MSVPHESPPNLAELLADDADKKVRTAAAHAHGEDPAGHLRDLADAVKLLAQAVRILAEKINDLERRSMK